ncbi:MAG: hypothetical protein RR313_11545 [Anaerovoracaceae bacterium]
MEQILGLETKVTYHTDKINNSSLWANASVFTDTAIGRNVKEHTALKKLLVKCRAGKVDLASIKSINRLGRNSLDINIE